MKSCFSRLACVAAIAVASGAGAQSVKRPAVYPNKTVRLVVPFAVGAPTDTQGRIIADSLSRRWGQPVIVDNRGAANGNMGMEIVARAPSDGYTLVIGTAQTWAVNPHLYKLPYDVLRDFSPITQVMTAPGVLVVHPTLNARSVKELIALATKKPGALNYGSSGVGGFGHLSGELFTLMSNIRMTHVPYASSAPAVNALVTGRIPVFFGNVTSTTPHVKAGRLRALATTGARRSIALPELPTIAEAGVARYQNAAWSGIAGAPRLSKRLVARLHKDLVQVLRTPDIRQRHAEIGAEIIASTPAQFQAYLKRELAKFGRLVKAAGITAPAGS